MTPIERFKELHGCTIVHVDEGRGLVVFWTGKKVFLEFHVEADGTLREGGAWCMAEQPRHPFYAHDAARIHYGLPEL